MSESPSLRGRGLKSALVYDDVHVEGRPLCEGVD